MTRVGRPFCVFLVVGAGVVNYFVHFWLSGPGLPSHFVYFWLSWPGSASQICLFLVVGALWLEMAGQVKSGVGKPLFRFLVIGA